ncbi:MAG TPA: tRNA 2-thiouridine(34) synthase MnmA [Candidatus Paceibacterota bacterium]|nr:tRNA 2-thiouridine(34) synthase MnmA [Candidatus Paceibacterota bacterium]
MKKVFVGLSGGVDSSVSAYLLKKGGYDVTGVFIRVWYPDFVVCDWRKEMHDAMRICAKLNIPFLLCDSENEYKKNVIDYMINEYKKGNTPNPDVMCNKEIKFKSFFNFAISRGADYIATGHYAQNKKNSEGLFSLEKSEDKSKDQTYFLWNLNQDILKKTLFPIGHLKKDQVRKIAQNANLITASKKDSQGLCFIGHVNMKDFLSRYIKIKSGNVVNESGQIVGKHDGAVLYTIGERHGFDVSKKQNNELPYYVIGKNIEKNILIVSKSKKIKKQNTSLKNINWITVPPEQEMILSAQIRYRQTPLKCKISKITNNGLIIDFIDEVTTLTSGQSIVFYLNNKCLGGGIIV